MPLAKPILRRESIALRKELVKFRFFIPLVAFLLLPALASVAASTPSPNLNTREDVGAFMMAYYLRPHPDLITGVIDAMHRTGFVEHAVSNTIGFFSEVFAANPDRIPGWQVLIATQDERLKTTLGRALAMSNGGGVLHIVDHSAEVNDIYWGAFFASGNPKFIKRLVDQVKYFDERDDFKLFMAGGTAKWSLASNAQSQPGVRTAIERAKPTSDKRTQDLLTELLVENPERIKQELREIITKQEQAVEVAFDYFVHVEVSSQNQAITLRTLSMSEMAIYHQFSLHARELPVGQLTVPF